MVMWVFGYASLIWMTGFEYDKRITGFIKGYRRAFHLACFEHRGTEEFPARVLTLEPDHDAICWGVAFCIEDDAAAQRALLYLKKRESEYDIVRHVEFFREDSPEKPFVSSVLVFMSTLDKETNKYYLGAAPRDDIAKQIAIATGPCGPNFEYVFRLVKALRQIGHEDVELIELERSVRRMLSASKAQLKHLSDEASSKTFFTSQSFVPKSLVPLIPSPVAVVSLNCSPRLVKSEAR